MSLTLYLHPLSSFCQKVLIALYENGTAFTPRIIDFGDPEQRAELAALWPVGRFPVLRDDARGRVVPESSIIIEYLDLYFPGTVRFVPDDRDLGLEVRQRDRFFDLSIAVPMQKIVTDRTRPADGRDAMGVSQARGLLGAALDVLEQAMAGRTFAVGERFTLADCAAAPALFYANEVMPLEPSWPSVASYLERLKQRPSYARALAEMQPYWGMFPKG